MVYIANEECDEEGWVVIVNAQGQKGYVPQNYLEMGEAAPAEVEAQPSVVEEPTQPWPNTQDYYRFVFNTYCNNAIPHYSNARNILQYANEILYVTRF